MTHCCHSRIVKAVPRRGRPLPDRLLPIEARYAKITQNYMAFWYREAEQSGFKPADLHLPLPVSDSMMDFSESYIGGWMKHSGEAAAKQVGVHITDYIDRPRVRAAIQSEAMKFLRTVDDNVKQGLRDTLIEGNKAGDSVNELRDRVKNVLGFDKLKEVYVPADLADPEQKLDNWRAEMIARTESAQSITLGEIEGWKESGVVSDIEWVAATDACPFCLDIDGDTMPLGTPFFVVGDSLTVIGENGKPQTMTFTYRDVYGPPLHPFCVLGETPVVAPDCIAGMSTRYKGPIIEIGLSDGRWLSVTPNHMLMTDHGFIPAQFLAEGDNVFRSTAPEREIFVNPDDNRNPSRVDNVVKAFAESPGMITNRVPASAEYLHGDARFGHGDIHIVRPDSMLRRYAAIPVQSVSMMASKLLTKVGFHRLNARTQKLKVSHRDITHRIGLFHDRVLRGDSAGPLTKLLHALARASDSSMGRRREAFSLACARALHSCIHPLAPVANVNTSLTQSEAKRVAVVPELIRKTLQAFPGLVAPTQIRRINIRDSVAHVYDLQCLSTMYTCNGVLSSNCRCACRAILSDDFQDHPRAEDTREEIRPEGT